MTIRIKKPAICCIACFWLNVFLSVAQPGFPDSQREIVDRIVALVNDEVITLTDVRIVQTFHLFSDEEGTDVDHALDFVLKKLIDQNLVVQLILEEISLQDGTIDAFIDEIVAEIGVEEYRTRLNQFGMTRADLIPYVSRLIAYQRIIADRFKTSITVGLREIENYYEITYVPAQKAKGLKAEPMLQILDKIETVIKQEKSKMQIEEWLKNLRDRADIQINL